MKVEFIEFSSPIYCTNDEQVSYIRELATAPRRIAQASCISNYTKNPLTYKLLSQSSTFLVFYLSNCSIMSLD